MEPAAVALSSVLPKLAALLQNEYKLVKRERKQIQFLLAELESLNAFIQRRLEAEHTTLQPERDPVEEVFFRDVLDLCYDVEDHVDSSILRPEHSPGMHPTGMKRFFKKVNLLMNRHRVAQELKDICTSLDEVTERRKRYQISTDVRLNTSNHAEDPYLRVLDADASTLVGVDGPRDELAKMLLTEEEPDSAAPLKLVSIVGCGGLGKTTLAYEVYRTIRAFFDCCAWVSLSWYPDMKKILTRILHQIDDDHEQRWWREWDERQLINRIRELLHDRRYLLVVDNVWTRWELIQCALPWNNLGSRILITTRNINVAESCSSNPDDCIYYIQPLSSEYSRILFLKRIFGSMGSCPPNLVDVSESILKKCSGLPLAITLMSGLLANKPCTHLEWMGVYFSLTVTPESMEGMRNICLLSYYDLPSHLKCCLLYLSILPDNYPFNRDHVVRSWIAEGFIQGKPGKTLEEVGVSYFIELVIRNIIQPVHGSYGAKTAAFLIHDMMLDLIRHKSIEGNFVTLLDNDNPEVVLPGKIRRLSIISVNEYNGISESMNMLHIRSLYIFGSVRPKLSFKLLTLLRVLNLEGCKDLSDNDIMEIPQLPHLRYLSIRDTPIHKLPYEIGKLLNLTMLDLRGTLVQELPPSVVHLQRLAHLLCGKICLPELIGNMVSLSCLSQFDIFRSETCAVEGLGNLYELRELGIWWDPYFGKSSRSERYNDLSISLYRLKKLQSLCISGIGAVDLLDHLCHPLQLLQRIELKGHCYLNRIPGWFTSLPSLTYVCINVNEVRNESLKLLSELPSLRQLSLSSVTEPTEKLVIPSKGFAILQVFQLHAVREDLAFEPQAMQNLEELLLSLFVLSEETYGFSVDIHQFMRLRKIEIRICGKGTDASKLFQGTNISVRGAAEEHPNHPAVSIIALPNFMH